MNSPQRPPRQRLPNRRAWATSCSLALVGAMRVLTAVAAPASDAPPAARPPLEFIDPGFENAAPLWYEVDTNGIVQIYLTYDHERASPNRAAGHIHFSLQARPGTTLRLEFNHLDSVWNGRPGSIAPELKTLVESTDSRHWTAVATEAATGNPVRLTVTMPGPRLYVARVEPYRLSDLDRRLEQLLRRHTWFTEGSTPPSFVNSGTLGDGWLERFGVDAAIHEFHCNWIAGLNEAPLARHWKAYGAGMAEVFYEYLGTVNP